MIVLEKTGSETAIDVGSTEALVDTRYDVLVPSAPVVSTSELMSMLRTVVDKKPYMSELSGRSVVGISVILVEPDEAVNSKSSVLVVERFINMVISSTVDVVMSSRAVSVRVEI